MFIMKDIFDEHDVYPGPSDRRIFDAPALTLVPNPVVVFDFEKHKSSIAHVPNCVHLVLGSYNYFLLAAYKRCCLLPLYSRTNGACCVGYVIQKPCLKHPYFFVKNGLSDQDLYLEDVHVTSELEHVLPLYET